MMKKLAAAVCLLCTTAMSMAQQAGYRPVKNSGKLPASVYTPSTIKYQEIIATAEKGSNVSEQKTQQQYYLESSFSIDDLLRSGLVLYDPVYHAYLEEIAGILFRDDPALNGKIDFYLLRSPVVNAFASGQGQIFISMGLIAMLDNESQLAFVMAHEAGHVANGHGLDFYMQSSAIDGTGSGKIMKNASFDEKLIAKNLYSQKLETEADSFGIRTILRTDYDAQSLNGVFDVLKYAYLPYENFPFPKSFFESEYYVISNNLMLDSVKTITGESELPPEAEALKSTHPSIGLRRELLNGYLETIDNKPKQATLVSESKFEQLKHMARYELPMFYLHNQYYQDAVYASYLSLLKDPENGYLRSIIAKALTSLAKFRNSSENESAGETTSYEYYEGEQQQVYYMLQHMSNAELTVLALRYTYDLHLQYPDNSELIPLCRSLVEDLAAYHFESDSLFIKSASITKDSLQSLADENVKKLSVEPEAVVTSGAKKTMSKKSFAKKQEPQAPGGNKSHLLYAFNDFWQHDEFRQLWVDVQQAATAVVKGINRQPVEKVVVINPFYLRVDVRKENTVEYVSSEEGEMRFVDILKENAVLLDVNIDIIDPLLMQEGDTERFNDMAALDNWFSEQLDFGSLTLPGYQQHEIDSLADKYGTDYFLWSGILSLQQRNNFLMPLVYAICSPLFFPLLPYGVYEMVSPEYEFFYLALLYNVKTQKSEILKYVFLEKNDTRAVLNSHTYDMFYRIKNGRE